MRTNYSNRSLGQINRNREFGRGLASHILAATVGIDSSEPVIEEDDGGFLVASKFEGRYYQVWQEGEAWQCSSREERVVARCLAQLQAFLAQRVAA